MQVARDQSDAAAATREPQRQGAANPGGGAHDHDALRLRAGNWDVSHQ
jgi:hypothetical protein